MLSSNSFTGGYPCANCGGWIAGNNSIFQHLCPRRWEPPSVVVQPIDEATIDRIADRVVEKLREAKRKKSKETGSRPSATP